MSGQIDSQLLFQYLPEFCHLTVKKIVSNLWPCSPSSSMSEDALRAYFYYCRDQCAIEDPSAHSAICQDDVKNLVTQINQNPTSSKSALREIMRQVYPHLDGDAAKLSNSIELAARLWLMMNVRTPSELGAKTLETTLPWPDDASLVEILGRCFTTSTTAPTKTNQKFLRILNIYNLEKIGGFRIEWTDNLIDHLRLKEKNTLCIFYHVSVLRLMKLTIRR